MLKLLNVISIFGWGFDLDLNDTLFWLYAAQAVIVFIGIIMFFILLARTRRSRREEVVVVEKVVEEQPVKEKGKKKKETAEPVVADTAATTAAEPQEQPQVIVVTPEPEKSKEPVERVLTGISLDVGVVQREFTAGEEFNCDGLLVRTNYNLEPLSETIIAYSVVDNDVYDRLSNVKDIKVCYVLRPDLSEAGIKFVTVKYSDQTAIYTVSVKEAPVVVEEPTPEVKEEAAPVVIEEAPAEPAEKVVIVERIVEKPVEVVAAPAEPTTIIVDEESIEAGKLRYDRSFTARFIQSDDELKHWYTELKNELLSYKKVHARISWKRETFKSGKEVVAKLAFRGKTLCLFLPLNIADYENTAYNLEDASNVPSAEDTPAMLRLKNYKRVRQAIELVEIAMQQKGITRIRHETEDFYVPYEGIVELINKGLIKREIKNTKDEEIFIRNKPVDDEDNDSDKSNVTEIVVSAKSLDEAEEAAENTDDSANDTPAEEEDKPSDKKGRKDKKSKK
ncbi:MAG: hypothetical protein J1F65_02300 [Clostridiales bacterium]|nr:hypothetical protein [Clostridiales bacterium]